MQATIPDLEWTAQGGLESPSLEVSKEQLDVALSALGRVTRWDRSRVALDEFGDLF